MGGRFPSSGYTLTEVLVVLLVIVILLSMGVPAMGKVIRRYQISTTVSDFYAALQLARSEAIRRGARIDLVPAENGRDWTRGWIVMQDKNGNRIADETDDIIFSHGPAPVDLTIRDGFNDGLQLYFAYNGSGYGRSHASSQAARAGSWTFTLGEESRKIIVNFTGRPRLCNPKEEPGDC